MAKTYYFWDPLSDNILQERFAIGRRAVEVSLVRSPARRQIA